MSDVSDPEPSVHSPVVEPRRVEPPPVPGGFLKGPWRWLDERYHLEDLVGFIRHKEVPVGGHAMVWYYLGGIALFFFTLQILTGILLLFLLRGRGEHLAREHEVHRG